MIYILVFISSIFAVAQEGFPTKQESSKIQFFTPKDTVLFAGDPMPFFSDSTFHIYWLLDKNHHEAMNGMGGHQWSHSSSKDLKIWVHHKNSINITAEKEKSICTGSVFKKDSIFYAYYALRTDTNADGIKEEYILMAKSRNGVDFTKVSEKYFRINPDKSLSASHFRDPFVFEDTINRQFVMLVSSTPKNALENTPEYGCVVYYISKNLINWEYKGDFYKPNLGFIPECTDLFVWKSTYYLLYTPSGGTRYCTSDSPYGPWKRPENDLLGCDYAYVYKSALYLNNRRIAVGFVPSRVGKNPNGAWLYAGSLILKEIEFADDNKLFLKNISEFFNISKSNIQAFNKKSPQIILPPNASLRFDINFGENSNEFSAQIIGEHHQKYQVKIDVKNQTVCLGNTKIKHKFNDLIRKYKVELIIKNDIVDLCVENECCLTNRIAPFKAQKILFDMKNKPVEISNISTLYFID